ncbi:MULTISPECIES: class II fructose-bisphosphate aldolase [unclassified Oceanobacillus]|uniref:class II fructose-bisphosphate aldolase n=1 Tax=unclassified Oceanobacillus TaxID=2630292 RepID=UPI00300DF41F
MLVTSKKLFRIAQRKKFAIPAVNFIDQYTLRAYIGVAEKLQLPIIVSFAQAHHEIMDLEEAALLGKYYTKLSEVPVVLHLDHGEDVAFVKRAIDLGFSSVMIDASQDSFEENVRKTKEVIAYAQVHDVVVEAEIGHVGSGDNYENHDHSDSTYTTIEDAKRFYQETKVDSLAVSIGTAHGTYIGQPKINFERLQDISNVVEVPLVLHGGSSTGDDNLARCASNGIVKINIFTDIINSSVSEVIVEGKNYFEIQQQMRTGMESCLTHYFEVFKTQSVTL